MDFVIKVKMATSLEVCSRIPGLPSANLHRVPDSDSPGDVSQRLDGDAIGHQQVCLFVNSFISGLFSSSLSFKKKVIVSLLVQISLYRKSTKSKLNCLFVCFVHG